MQLHTSKALSSDLKAHLVDAPINLATLQWYGHRVQVLRRKCVILMEAQSRYAMLFTGLTAAEFKQFPNIFRYRLLREMTTISELDDERTERLAPLVDALSAELQVVSGSDRSVQAHINDVARELKYTVEGCGYLPKNAEQEFGFARSINQSLRTRGGEREYFYPEQVLREFWVGLLEHVEQGASGAFSPSDGLH